MAAQNYSGNTERLKGLWTNISWSSIFAGFIVAVIIHFLLNLLGLAIGMAAIQPMQQQNPFEGLGTGALIWWFVSILLSVFAGGFVAGRWAGALKTSGRAFHGILSWALFTIFSFWLLTTAVGGIIGGAGSIIGQVLSVAGTGLSEVGSMASDELQKQGVTVDIRQEVQRMIGGGTTGAAGESREIIEAFQQYMDTGSEEDRKQLAQEISARTGMSAAEADQEIIRLESRFSQAKEDAEIKAREIGEEASDAISKAAFISFFAMVLGAGASAWGGGIARRDIETVVPEDSTTAS
jgi:hypothetical protein